MSFKDECEWCYDSPVLRSCGGCGRVNQRPQGSGMSAEKTYLIVLDNQILSDYVPFDEIAEEVEGLLECGAIKAEDVSDLCVFEQTMLSLTFSVQSSFRVHVSKQ
jgi:hypothetical protein